MPIKKKSMEESVGRDEDLPNLTEAAFSDDPYAGPGDAFNENGAKPKVAKPEKTADKKGKSASSIKLKRGPAPDPSKAFTGFEDPRIVSKGLERFVRSIVTAMIALSEKGKLSGKTLYFVSLTVPEPKRTASLLYASANRFARWCSKEGGTAWLMADWSQQKVGHWHGLVLTSRRPKEMRTKWNLMTGASWSGQDFQEVWHQDPKSPDFVADIAKIVISYASKDVPVEASRVERAVAAGLFAKLWTECMGHPPMDASFLPLFTQVTAGAKRVCQYAECQKEFVPARSSQYHCSTDCRENEKDALNKASKSALGGKKSAQSPVIKKP